MSCAANESWVDSYNCVGRFPKYWKALLLVASSRDDLTVSQLNRINMRDPNAISNLFELAGQLPEGMRYPSGFLNKALSRQLFLRRFADLSDRIREFKSTGALADHGTVDYSKFASYVVVWGGECRHRGRPRRRWQGSTAQEPRRHAELSHGGRLSGALVVVG